MTEPEKRSTGLPRSQTDIRARCVHPTGQFIEFPREEVERTIADRFARQAARFPGRLAVKTRHHELTYAELDRAANCIARHLQGRLHGKSEPIAILLEQGAPAICAVLGVLKAGKPCVVLDPSHPPGRTTHALEDSQARVILSERRHLVAYQTRDAEPIALEDIDASGDGAVGDAGASADSPAFILYTSGSTGQPKGVLHSSRSLLHFEMNYTNALHICPDDRLTALRSMSVIGGVRDVLAAVLNGAAVYPLDVGWEGVAPLAGWLEEHEITVAFFGSPLFRQFIQTLRGSEAFPSLRAIRLGSDTVRKSDVEAYRRHFAPTCILVNGLGGTETGTLCKYFIDKDTPITTATVPIGYPLEDMTVLVLGEDDREVGDDEVGEITVRSRYLSQGYWRRPDLTASTFRSGPAGDGELVYRTGNLGRRHPDGCLEHLGRRAFLVKVRGYRVELPEIEAALMALDGIREAIVTVGLGPSGENRLIAFVVPNSRPAPTQTALRHGLAQQLPGHMIPADFILLDAMPLNEHGKVDRAALPLPGRTRPNLDSPFVAPRTSMEEKLAAIWADVLGLDRVGIHDSFLDLGGDSLLATRIIARTLDTLGADVSVRTLLESPTVASMAIAMLEASMRAAGAHRLPADEPEPPLRLV